MTNVWFVKWLIKTKNYQAGWLARRTIFCHLHKHTNAGYSALSASLCRTARPAFVCLCERRKIEWRASHPSTFGQTCLKLNKVSGQSKACLHLNISRLDRQFYFVAMCLWRVYVLTQFFIQRGFAYPRGSHSKQSIKNQSAYIFSFGHKTFCSAKHFICYLCYYQGIPDFYK